MSVISNESFNKAKQTEFLNDLFKMFPDFFSKENKAVELWVEAYKSVFEPYKGRKTDYEKLRMFVFSSIDKITKPPAPNKIKEVLLQCFLKEEAENQPKEEDQQKYVSIEELPPETKAKILNLKKILYEKQQKRNELTRITE